MRVLALRARNLASLPEFELDLTSGPLARTRIFAIVGPTGSGKSTLLDALCLALYDRAPRLSGTRDLSAGELEVSPSDPRSLMRRGTGEASAEVDFAAADGRRYRATWEVWRARKRAGGKIQSQRMRLLALDDDRDLTGATKTETLDRISALVGLGYDEFRRAVLLAQGDFAAFLKAREGERAALLERLTGTEIYARLSKAAFGRAKTEEEQLRKLEGELAAEAPLSAEARAALEAQRSAASEARQSEEGRARALEARLRTEEALKTLLEEIAHQAQALEEARRARAAGEVQRLELAAFRRAERLQGDTATLLKREQEGLHCRAELEQAEAERMQQEQRREEAARSEARALAELASRRELERALGPEIEEARVIEARLAELERSGQAQATALLQRTETARLADLRRDAAKAAAQKARTARESARAWIETHPVAQRLATDGGRWQRDLAQYRLLAAAEVEAANEQLRSAEAEAAATVRAEAVAREKLEQDRQAQTQAAAAEQARLSLEATRATHPPKAVQQSLERVLRELASLEAMERLAAHARRASRALKQAEKDLASLRPDLLAPGRPCPLCGAEAHPYADHERLQAGAPGAEGGPGPSAPEAPRGIQVEAAVEDALFRTEETSAEAPAERLSRVAKQRPEVARLESEWRTRLESLQLLWIDEPRLAHLGLARRARVLPAQAQARTASAALAEVRAAFVEAEAGLRAQLVADTQLTAVLEQARAARDRVLTQQQETAQRAQKQRDELGTLHASVLALGARRLEAARRTTECLARLGEVFDPRGPWREELKRDPDAFNAAALAEVEAHRTQAALFEAESHLLLGFEQEFAQASAEAALHQEELGRARAAQAALNHGLAECRRARAAKLGGQSIEASIEAARARVELAAEQAGLAAQTLQAAREALSRAGALVTAQTEAVRRAARAEEDARTQLSAALRAAEIPDRATLTKLLGLGVAWAAAQEEALVALDAAVVRSESALEDRQGRLRRRLEAEGRSELPQLAAVTAATREAALAFEVARLEVQRALEREAQLNAESSRDELARKRAARLAPAIDAQRVTSARWAELSGLIGSADGKKLRTFAQSLTLEVLLEQANVHLAKLRPRYRLASVTGQDMELQVIDADLGEEVRSVSTLSGGETFLVSLSLALALSSLSARNVRIRSLFIDEGFGTLDRETIDTALGALDQLQAEGRTIGLISHVPELAERIGFQVEVRPTGPGRSEVHVG